MPTTVTYGPTVVATPTPATTDGNALAFDTTALSVYDAQTGGTQITALTAFGAGTVVGGQVVPSATTGAVGFSRSDGVVAVVWVEDPGSVALGTPVRYPVFPNELSSLIATSGLLPAGGATGQVPAKTSGADYAYGWTTLTATSIGLGSVDNTADTAKPVSTAQQTALDAKQDDIPTYATLTDANTAVAAGTLADGDLCVIVNPGA